MVLLLQIQVQQIQTPNKAIKQQSQKPNKAVRKRDRDHLIVGGRKEMILKFEDTVV